MQPKVLLCDEATSALDPRTAESILNLLKEINEKTGITIIVVAHQLSVIRNICTHMAILEDGHLACHGATTEIFMQAPAALRRLQGNRAVSYTHLRQRPLRRCSFAAGILPCFSWIRRKRS